MGSERTGILWLASMYLMWLGHLTGRELVNLTDGSFQVTGPEAIHSSFLSVTMNLP